MNVNPSADPSCLSQYCCVAASNVPYRRIDGAVQRCVFFFSSVTYYPPMEVIPTAHPYGRPRPGDAAGDVERSTSPSTHDRFTPGIADGTVRQLRGRLDRR